MTLHPEARPRRGNCVEFLIAHDLSPKPITIPVALVRKIIGGHHIFWPAS